MARTVHKVVIPAGGLGTRFLPVTKSVPKELLPIGTKPTLQIVLEEAIASGLDEVVLVTSEQKRQLADYFRTDTAYDRELAARGKAPLLEELNGMLAKFDVRVVHQDEPLGLGDAILRSREAVGEEPFVVILPDVLIESRVPCCRQLMEAFETAACSLSATEHTPEAQIHLYGIYDIARSKGAIHWARRVIEKPSAHEAPSDLSVVGRYLFTPEIFEALAHLTPGRGGEIQLADAMDVLARQGRMAALEYEGRQFDTGDPVGFLKANIYYSFRSKPHELTAFLHELIASTPPERAAPSA
jgi:UTP--glucose-1-phosphate uridylyltransferase